MTFSPRTLDKFSHADFEFLPSLKNLDLPLGIRCMEMNVQEVDEAVRHFSLSSSDITSPSWKFPHVPLEKLDVYHVMSTFRGVSSISDQQLYMELMELLIDRLYYAIMTSFQFVNGLEALFLKSGKIKLEPKKSATARGPKEKKSKTWDPLEIAKKSSRDNTPRPFHTANIGMLVRQFSMKMLALENIVLNNLHSLKKQQSKSGVGSSTGVSVNPSGLFEEKKPKDQIFTLRHSEVQTDQGMQDGCDSCFISHGILKIVADMVDLTLRQFNSGDSRISQTRFQLRKEGLAITQRGTLLRWLQALKEDCESITKCANILLDTNVRNKEELRGLKELIELKDDDYMKKLRAVEESFEKLEKDLTEEKEARNKLSKQKDSLFIKSLEQDKALQAKTKECDKLSQEREALQRSFNIAEELNLQIKSNLARSLKELERLKRTVQEEDETNQSLSNQVRTLSMELAKAGQEILKLRDNSDKAETLHNENKELKHQVKRLSGIVRNFENENEDIEKALHERDLKIQKLEKELEKAEEKIDVLTLYPDLNGPINAPMRTSEFSCVETMEMQVKSNKIRMEILRTQSERLATTVSKLKAHMKSKSKTDVN